MTISYKMWIFLIFNFWTIQFCSTSCEIVNPCNANKIVQAYTIRSANSLWFSYVKSQFLIIFPVIIIFPGVVDISESCCQCLNANVKDIKERVKPQSVDTYAWNPRNRVSYRFTFYQSKQSLRESYNISWSNSFRHKHFLLHHRN